jgi:hypothetical protein
MGKFKDKLYEEGNVDLARKLSVAYISHKERLGLDDCLKRHVSEVPSGYWLMLAKTIEPGLAASRGNPWPELS